MAKETIQEEPIIRSDAEEAVRNDMIKRLEQSRDAINQMRDKYNDYTTATDKNIALYSFSESELRTLYAVLHENYDFNTLYKNSMEHLKKTAAEYDIQFTY